ncbi:MAG: rod shape-determining protein RodA [Ignavibacteriae bacterium]|nr:MAG: rod shape-determining protein RodA [Ignavibacteriota bacterium]
MEQIKKVSDRFEFTIFISVLVLIGFGLMAIYSATHNHPTAQGNFNKQAYFAVISLILFFVAYYIPYKNYRLIAVPAYFFSILLLLSVLFLGKTVYGAKSWISFGGFGFQPSEFAKIGFIFFLAHFLTPQQKNPNNPKDLFLLFIYSLIPIILILLEPDLGTAIVYVLITIVILFWSGVDLFWFFFILSPIFVVFASLFGTAAFIISMIIIILLLFYFKKNLFVNTAIVMLNLSAAYLFDYGLHFLKPHQQKRIETFVNPMADPLGAGYNILQTKVAIGSGGLFGKGFLQGNQTQLRFIPEQWTDFIFCVIGEEFGFIGSVLIVTFFLILIGRLIYIATHTKNKFGSMVVMGTAALIITHFTINVGMNLGVAPVIGLPLPFMSYGGSSLIVNMILLGVSLNFYKNRRQQI